MPCDQEVNAQGSNAQRGQMLKRSMLKRGQMLKRSIEKWSNIKRSMLKEVEYNVIKRSILKSSKDKWSNIKRSMLKRSNIMRSRGLTPKSVNAKEIKAQKRSYLLRRSNINRKRGSIFKRSNLKGRMSRG